MILEAVFNGNLSPVEQVYPADPEYRTETETVAKILEQLSATLSAEQFEQINALMTHNGFAQCIENEACFGMGFAMGMMLEREIQDKLRSWEKEYG